MEKPIIFQLKVKFNLFSYLTFLLIIIYYLYRQEHLYMFFTSDQQTRNTQTVLLIAYAATTTFYRLHTFYHKIPTVLGNFNNFSIL